IAGVVMQKPKRIPAGEPIASLEPRNAQVVMDSLRHINSEGITVITKLQTLETARAYCERIVRMSGGRVVFDGPPKAVTTDVARQIYGADGLNDAFSEAMTSTSVAPLAPPSISPVSAPAP